MNRNDAGMAIKRCTYLGSSEKLVFLVLLEVANNRTCALEDKFSRPTINQLALWTSLHRTTVMKAVEHLEQHKWMSCERVRGRGNTTRYSLVKEMPQESCDCPQKVVSSDRLTAVKGRTEQHKRSDETTQKVGLTSQSSQVENAFARRDAGKREGIPRPCDRCESTNTQIIGAYRLCEAHAGPQWKETA